jgi:hypothetical protein
MGIVQNDVSSCRQKEDILAKYNAALQEWKEISRRLMAAHRSATASSTLLIEAENAGANAREARVAYNEHIAHHRCQNL